MYDQLTQSLIEDKNILNYRPDVSTIDQYLIYLRKVYKFGDPQLASKSQNSTRKTIFDIAVRPCLIYSQKKLDLDLYSRLDHYLFQSYICAIEELDWFSNAFWDVNSYGLSIARDLSKRSNFQLAQKSSSNKKVLFVFKGPYALAHSNVLHDFLSGINTIEEKPEVHLLLIDAEPLHIPGIKVISFSKIQSTSGKILSFMKYCSAQSFNNIVWVACIQNLALYMGIRMANQQSYWTMKRHSIVFPEITKYATFISQYRNQTINNAFWYGGRYRLKATPSSNSKQSILNDFNLKIRAQIQNNFVFGSLARSQKYQSIDYWKGIELLLLNSEKSIFIYGSHELPAHINNYINNSNVLTEKLINFGWLDGKTADIASLIQIYIDTIPFGSGLTALECVLSGGCYLGTLSEINKEASFTNILVDALNLSSNVHQLYNQPIPEFGIFSKFSDCLNTAYALRQDPEKLTNLNRLQKKKLIRLDSIGQKYFTSDYLQYFASNGEFH